MRWEETEPVVRRSQVEVCLNETKTFCVKQVQQKKDVNKLQKNKGVQ